MGRRGERAGMAALRASHGKVGKFFDLFSDEWERFGLDEEDLDIASDPHYKTRMIVPMIQQIAIAGLTRFSVIHEMGFRLSDGSVGNFVAILHTRATIRQLMDFLEFHRLALPAPDEFQDEVQCQDIVSHIPRTSSQNPECRVISSIPNDVGRWQVFCLHDRGYVCTSTRDIDEPLASIRDFLFFVIEKTNKAR